MKCDWWSERSQRVNEHIKAMHAGPTWLEGRVTRDADMIQNAPAPGRRGKSIYIK